MVTSGAGSVVEFVAFVAVLIGDAPPEPVPDPQPTKPNMTATANKSGAAPRNIAFLIFRIL